MSFSSSGVTLSKTQMMRNRMGRFFMRGLEGFLSILFVISLAMPAVFPDHAYAALGVSSKLSYQGRLADANGNPLGGGAGTNYYVCFSIYDSISAGTKLWPAGVPNNNTVLVTNGVFNTNIGTADALNFDFSSNDTVYLNVGVSATNTTCDNVAFENLTPRQRMDATPYARVAENLYGGNARIGTGTGALSGSQKYLHLDNMSQANVESMGGACPSGSLNGSMWYNSSRTRALACVNNVVVAIDNVADFSGIKESAAGSTVNAGSIILSNAGGISISQSTATLATNQTNQIIGTFGFSNLNAGGISTMGNTLGTNGTGTGSVYWAGGNNITLSQVTGVGARTITIIGPSGGGGVAMGAGASTATSGTVIFSNANGVSFGLNNGTITGSVAAGAAGATISRFMWPQEYGGLSNITAPAQGTMSIQYLPLQANLSASRMDVVMSISLGTSAIANTAGVAITQRVGIYSRNGLTLNTIATGSNQQTISWASNSGSYSSITGIRYMSVPLAVNIGPGDYYVGYAISTAASSLGTATTALSPILSIMGGTFATAGVHASNWGITATSNNVYSGMGVYSAQINANFTNLSLSAIGQTGLNVSKANYWVQLRNV